MDPNRIDGGAAFPTITSEENRDSQLMLVSTDHPGMSLRDYFAAHAPAEPQSWYHPPEPASKRPAPQYVSDYPIPDGNPLSGGSSVRHFADAAAAERACGDCYHAANQDALDAWDQQQKKLRAIGWPWAWADAMIAMGRPQ